MNAFLRAVRILSGGMCFLAAFILFGMVVLTCGDVVGRYFGHPITGTYDLVGLFGGAVLSLGIAGSARMQVRMDSLYKRPEVLRRAVDVFASVIGVGTVALISWRCFKLGRDLWRMGRVSETIQVPVYPFLILAGVGMAVFCLTILVIDLLTPSDRHSSS
jgi:TRAP-type C4-dicarboxylate transport system permease small subunit